MGLIIAMSLKMHDIAKRLASSSIFSQSYPTALSDNTLESRLEPLHCVILPDLVSSSNRLIGSSSPPYSRTGSCHAAVEVHTVDTNRGVVLDAQIDVLRDAEAEVASVGEVLLAQFVFLDLETALEDFFGLGTSDRAVDGDLFVSSNAEGADSVAGFAC